MVSNLLQDWEQRFHDGISLIEVVPRHGEWGDFLGAVKIGWNDWQRDLRFRVRRFLGALARLS